MARKKPLSPPDAWDRAKTAGELFDLLTHNWNRVPTAAAYTRKARLLAAAAVRVSEANIADPAVRAAVGTAERAIDDAAKPAEVRAAWRAVAAAVKAVAGMMTDHLRAQLRAGTTAEPPPALAKEQAFLRAVARALGWAFEADTSWTFDDLQVLVAPYDSWFHWVSHTTDLFHSEAAERAADRRLVGLVRDLFGTPFAPVAFDKKWQTDAVAGLASTVHEGRVFDRLPVLADALEEAGCNEPMILEHCRAEGEHARGCWVIDGLFGRNYKPRG